MTVLGKVRHGSMNRTIDVWGIQSGAVTSEETGLVTEWPWLVLIAKALASANEEKSRFSQLAQN